MSARTFQDVIQTLNRYWAAQGLDHILKGARGHGFP